MIINTDKCKVVHFGYKNTAADYSLGDVNIQSGKEEKDLGIIINQSLKSTVRSSSKLCKQNFGYDK